MWGLEGGVWGLGFGVHNLGLMKNHKFKGLGFRAGSDAIFSLGFVFHILGSGFRISDLKRGALCGVARRQGAAIRGSGFRFRMKTVVHSAASHGGRGQQSAVNTH